MRRLVFMMQQNKRILAESWRFFATSLKTSLSMQNAPLANDIRIKGTSVTLYGQSW